MAKAVTLFYIQNTKCLLIAVFVSFLYQHLRHTETILLSMTVYFLKTFTFFVAGKISNPELLNEITLFVQISPIATSYTRQCAKLAA